MKNQFSAVKSYTSLKTFLNGLSLFLGIFFLGLMSCSTVNNYYTSLNPTKDNIPPTVTISTNKSLEIDMTGTITFTFSEEVTNFTPNDVKFSSDDFSVNSVSDIVITNFITNNPKEYSLEITPKTNGILTISIPANSFEDLSGNQNTDSFSTNFSVEDKTPDTTPPTVAISTNKSLEIDIPGTITFTFSEKVNNFTLDDIQFNGVSVDKGNFFTNSQESYSLEITPKAIGTLYVSIQANSFEDLSGNQNTDSFSNNFSVEDKTPPTVNISSDTLIEGTSAFLSFTFSEKVNNFTPDDIQFLTNKANGVNAEKGNFITNSQKSYSLEITPETNSTLTNGTLYVSIQANSFEDLSANQNDKPYSSNFTVFDSTTTTHTISFKLNGGSFISSKITTLKVVNNTGIKETRLEGILSYPPTGPKPSIQAVTRGIFEWRNTNGTKYDFSTPVSNDLTLEAVWSNSCGKVETFHPTNNDELLNYVNASVGANTNLNHIDTSAITDMSRLFADKDSFNGKIDCWNTANVNNMGYMFQNATAFNQDTSSWDVANVNDMKNMFDSAHAFNQNIGSWDVANVNNMTYMFNRASAFNQDIGSWNVSNVNNMSGMFLNATAFNQDIGSWDVGNVINMSWMFYYARAFNQDIGSWNVANVNTMNRMFYSSSAFDQDLSKWSVSSLTNHDGMKWLVSSVNHDDMFTGSAMESKTAKHPKFYSNPTDSLPPTVNINSQILIERIPASLSFTFSEKVSNFTPDDIQFLTNETNGVNAAKGSFVTNSQKSYSLEITPETNGTLYVSIQANSFYDLSGNQNDKPYSSNFTVLDSSTAIHTISFKLNGGSFIFSQITNLKVFDNTAIEETQLGGILSYPPTGPKPSIQAVTRDVFEWRNNNGTKYDFSTPVRSDLTLEAVWSNSCGKVETVHPANKNELQNYVDTAVGANPIPPRYTSSIKNNINASVGANTNLNHIDTSAITDMNKLFYNKLSFNGNIYCWHTANVNNMDGMFYNAYAFNQNISSWNVANVTDMGRMFANATAFNQDIGRWNTANVNNMDGMFNNAYAFNQDIGSWDVSRVNNMWGMFSYARAFNQDIGRWNTANVNTMYAMFYDVWSFNQDIGRWNVGNVNNMGYMFYRAFSFNQDISSWDVSNVTDMNRMFDSAWAFNKDLSSWSVSNVTNYDNIFSGSAMASETDKHPVFNKP